MYYSTIKTPAVIAAGFVIFLVANIIFFINICQVQDGHTSSLQLCVMFVVFSMEIVFIIYSTTNFLRGLKQHDPGLLLPWLGIKTVEIFFLFTGIVSLMWFPNHSNNNILVPIGFIALLIGLYIVLDVCITYKDMKKHSQIPYIIYNSPELEHPPEMECPPSYEESQEYHQNHQTYNVENRY